jgi:putative transposase
MVYDLDKSSHSVYSLHYHLVLVVKYRRRVFTEDMKNFMRGSIEGFADNYGVEIERLEADGDHVHILFNGQ